MFYLIKIVRYKLNPYHYVRSTGVPYYSSSANMSLKYIKSVEWVCLTQEEYKVTNLKYIRHDKTDKGFPETTTYYMI
jgi:hypothetical protein